MNTARIVVLTIAAGAGGAAAYLASGSDLMAASLLTRSGVRAISTEISPETGTLSPALRDIGDRNAIATSPEHQSPKRGDRVNVAHYGVSTPTRTLK
jgi:pilus assembly protein CpaB